jgi:uncharacterized protein YqhQ
MEKKLRLGGMALENGVLVHGPTSWAAAVRDEAGAIRVASGRKPRFGGRAQIPFVRGPLRLAEAFALIPEVKRRLPQARLGVERPGVAAAVVVGSVGASMARHSQLSVVAREAVVAIASLAPALLALRGGELASYHGAEHVSIGTYESDAPAAKEHGRCGSHLVGPLMVTSAVAGALAGRVPASHRRLARLAGAVGAVGVAVELFAWASSHPDRRLARLLNRPGFELQRRLATEDPTPEQLEVAEAALRACLAAEAAAAA